MPWLIFFAAGCAPEPTKGVDSTSENLAPVLTVDVPADGDTVPGLTRVAGFVADDRDDPGSVAVTVTDSVSAEATPLTVSVGGAFDSTVTLSPGAHVLTFVAVDTEGAESSRAVGVTVAENSAPSTPTIAVHPDPAITGDALAVAFTVESVDPDGDTVLYGYSWSVDGNDAGTGVSIAGAAVSRGQTWTVTVIASDGAHDAPAAVAAVVIGNSPPTTELVEIQPAAPTVADALTCVATGVRDPEGDTFTSATYWLVDGVEIAEVGDVLAAGTVHGGQTVSCGVSLDDGRDVATYDSAVITVAGSPPTAPTVTVTPDPPMDTDDLSCVASDSVDPDGLPLTTTYAWTVDGAVSGVTDAVVSASATHRDEQWSCIATMTDVEGLQASASSAGISIGLAWADSISASAADVTIDGVVADGAFGKTIALVGDTNGDGLSELVAGANGEDAGSGAVYLFDGAAVSGAITTADAAARWTGSAAGAALGAYRAIAAPGDLDGDGLSEIMFAAPDDDENGDGAGIAMLQYGGGTPASGDAADAADWTVVGTLGDEMGARITTGDLDGDGQLDVILAAPRSSDSFRNSGTVSMFAGTGLRWSGRADIADADFQVSGDDESDELGWTTKFIGDVNGDGFDDLFATAMYADTGGVDAGLGGIIAGGTALSGSDVLSGAAVTLFAGDASDDRFGYDAAGGVDFDDDGIGDLVLGEYQDDTMANNAGAIRIFLGRAGWASDYVPSDADQTIRGASADDRFGHVLHAPGDMDGDGTGDLLIGALFADPTGLTYQGGAWLLLSPDWDASGSASTLRTVIAGEAANDWFGDALGFGQGDINGDGRFDFAVGAQAHDEGASATGRVYLWFGR